MRQTDKTQPPFDLKQIYRDYRMPFLKWLTGKYSIASQDAEDIFQNAVVILHDYSMTGKLDQLRCGIKTYLFGIGLNLTRDFIRARKKNPNGPDLLLKYVADDSDAEDKVQFEQDLKLALAVMDQLGEPCRSILQYFYFDKLSLEAIAQLLHYKNAESIKVQKCKCLKRLRKLMQSRSVTSMAPHENAVSFSSDSYIVLALRH